MATDTNPLAAAVSAGHLETVKMLLQHRKADNTVCGDLEQALELAIQTGRPSQMEMVESLLSHGANVDQRYQFGDTPILLASQRGNPQLVDCLIKAGADWTVVNRHGWSILHNAASSRSSRIFARFSGQGAPVHLKNNPGVSPLHLAMTHDIFTSLIINNNYKMELTPSFPWFLFANSQFAWIGSSFRVYRKRFGDTLLRHIANMQPKKPRDWSPLCLMSAGGNTTAMENLIQLGASLDGEGSPSGSALSTACANRQLESVKLLVRRGASISYIGRTHGGRISCLASAQGSAVITRWLLVSRFTDQQKITNIQSSLDNAESGFVKPWSGITKAELVITGVHERAPSESSLKYFVRLKQLRRDMRGRQVPVTGFGRGTCRPSRLVPRETVRIHPDDKRAPR